MDQLRTRVGDQVDDISSRRVGRLRVVSGSEQWHALTEAVIGLVADDDQRFTVSIRWSGERIAPASCTCDSGKHCGHILAMLLFTFGQVLTVHDPKGSDWRAPLAIARTQLTRPTTDPANISLMLLFVVTAQHGLAFTPAVRDRRSDRGRTDLVSWADFCAGSFDDRFDRSQQVLVNALRETSTRPPLCLWLPGNALSENCWGIFRALSAPG